MPENRQKTQQTPNPKPRRRKLDIWNKIAVVVLTCFLVVCISVFFILVNVINDPDGMRFSQDGLSTLSNSRIYDGEGTLIYEFGDEIREDVTYDQIPQSVIDAFLSIEDSRFFDHHGFDLPRFMAAAINNLRSGDLSQGGSTLTMQMIDNAFTKNQEQKLEAEQGDISTIDNIKLKVQEIYLALIAEQSISKEDIFEYYVNRIWFGSGGNTRGLQKAANYYFNKDVSELNLGEAAFLAGSINSPALYNPLNNMYDTETDYLANATARRNVTLQLMLDHGYITEEEYDLAVNSRLEFALNYVEQYSENPNDAYIAQAIEECKTTTGQDPAIIPMDIYTALNTAAQAECDAICKGNNPNIAFPNDAFDVGFSLIDNATGEILCVGPGRTYHTAAVKRDNSTDRKQPGSSMKPLLAYAPTFDILGWATTHTVNDKAADYFTAGTNLVNSDGTYQGNMSLQDALGVSKNTTAAAAMVDLINTTGLDYWVDYCSKLGYDEDVCENFTAQYAIGGADMWASPIQQASAYTIFGNGGQRINAHRIRKVIRRADNEEIAGNSTSYELISTQAAFMMSTLLEKVVTGGYNNYNQILASSYPVYAKSGTSDWGDVGLVYGIPKGVIRDEWSVAYTNKYTIACWSGYTQEYFSQGYYMDIAQLNYATAFYINHYMLDFMNQYGGYAAIGRPDGVSDYNGGYIKSEFEAQGDNTATSAPTVDEATACANGGGTWDSEAGVCITKQEENTDQTACEGSGGSWDGGACSCPDGYQLNGTTCQATESQEPEPTTDPAAECAGQGGTWNGTSCDFPTPETPSETPDAGTENTEGGEVTGFIFPNFRGLFNLFSWL